MDHVRQFWPKERPRWSFELSADGHVARVETTEQVRQWAQWDPCAGQDDDGNPVASPAIFGPAGTWWRRGLDGQPTEQPLPTDQFRQLVERLHASNGRRMPHR